MGALLQRKLVDFIRFQADLLHELLPGAVVMHDFPGGGLTKHVSYADVAACWISWLSTTTLCGAARKNRCPPLRSPWLDRSGPAGQEFLDH